MPSCRGFEGLGGSAGLLLIFDAIAVGDCMEWISWDSLPPPRKLCREDDEWSLLALLPAAFSMLEVFEDF